jgi:adenylate kinase
LVLLGAPGSGKGCQAKLLSEGLKISWISPGVILREEVRKNSSLGKKVGVFVNTGELVPDDIILEVVKKRIEAPGCKNGFILDGFPRTLTQAMGLERLLKDRGEKLDKVIKLDVSEKTVIQRLSKRLVCSVCGAAYNVDSQPPKTEGKCDLCGGELTYRTDDQKNSILNRIRVHNEKTKPIEEYYHKKGQLKVIDGEGDPESVRDRIMKEIRK